MKKRKRQYRVGLRADTPSFTSVVVEAFSAKQAQEKALQGELWQYDWREGDMEEPRAIGVEELEVPHG